MESIASFREPQAGAVPAARSAMVRLESVSRSFALGHTTVHALRNVTLDIGRGEMVALWGPSGSGKSTLLNMMGLIDSPDCGRVTFDGKDVHGLSDNDRSDCRNHKIGFIFQNFNLIPVMSALENVMLPLQLQGRSTQVAQTKARTLLDAVGLGPLMKMRPDRLSGGQRQRVAIARALVIQPMLVIADEPTANLDSENSRSLIALMQQMNLETGVTFIFSTHDQRLLDSIPRHLQMRDGELVQDQQAGERS